VGHLFRRINLTVVFLLFQAILYVAFLLLDLRGDSNAISAVIKYTIIIGCFLYSLIPERGQASLCRSLNIEKSVYRSTLFCMQAALFCTAIADLFILILDYYLYGVVAFILVQEFYSARLLLLRTEEKGLLLEPAKERKSCGAIKSFAYALLKRILLQLITASASSSFLVWLGVNSDPLFLTSVFYFICIVYNVGMALQVAIRNPKIKSNLVYAIGMLLFLLCDINVGLFNLSGFVTIPEEMYSLLYSLSSILMWTFYAPSQVLIALSSKLSGQGEQHNLQKASKFS
jgi:hypothetical protein